VKSAAGERPFGTKRPKTLEEVDTEGRGSLYYLGLSALFVVGIVVGSELAVRGARGIVTAFGLNQTVFGMTVVGAAMSLEEVTLVVAPIREGRPSIAVGNIVGSLIFFATGNVGLLAVTRGFAHRALCPDVLLAGVFRVDGRDRPVSPSRPDQTSRGGYPRAPLCELLDRQLSRSVRRGKRISSVVGQQPAAARM